LSSNFNFEAFEHELLNPLRGHQLTEYEAFVANLLLEASSKNPMQIAEIILEIGRRFGDWPKEREVKNIVRTLRKEHAFPIISRRCKPSGLWWCGSAEEMNEFIETFRSQALDELHTLTRIVKENYPALAGQLTLEEQSDGPTTH
jgi:hypothetical protein